MQRHRKRSTLQFVGLPIHGFYDMKDCISGIERVA
jgi:hypothetical protein